MASDQSKRCARFEVGDHLDMLYRNRCLKILDTTQPPLICSWCTMTLLVAPVVLYALTLCRRRVERP